MRRALGLLMGFAVTFAISAALVADEAAKAGDVDAKVKKLIADGGNYYSSGQLDKAASCADEALALKPDSAAAKQLKQMTAEASKGKTAGSAPVAKKSEVDAYREAVVTEVERQMDAPVEVLKMPANWEDIKKRRAGSGEAEQVAKENQALERQLDSTTVDLNFENPTTLKDAAGYLATLTKTNIVVDPRAMVNGKPATDAEITFKAQGIKLRNAVNWLTRLNKLTWTIRDQVVFITDAQHLDEMKVTAVYDIRDLTEPGYDYPSDRDFDVTLPAVNARALLWNSYFPQNWWSWSNSAIFTGAYFADSGAQKRAAMTEDEVRELVEQLLDAEDAKVK